MLLFLFLPLYALVVGNILVLSSSWWHFAPVLFSATPGLKPPLPGHQDQTMHPRGYFLWPGPAGC